MGTSPLHKMIKRIGICLSVATLVAACSGGSGGIDPQDQAPSIAPVVPTGNTPSADPALGNEFVPDLGAALAIDYEAPNQDLASSNEFIESQWLHMQTCLQVSAQQPSVSVVDGKLTQIDSNDDVVRHIDGQVIASSHVTDTSASVQVRSEDFDGSLGEPGSYLRSIMGRYLWLANSLAERDYPYDCAKTK